MASENLVIRLVVLSQDAGAIIGKEGRTIRSFRDESGANISISGSAGVERILSISGSTNRIKTACRLIGEKLEEVSLHEMASDPDIANPSGDGRHIAPVTFRLLVPNSQCGPLIGKGGSKIKEIREASGATITIPSETLPGSSERAVTVSGSPDAISQCVYNIADVMLEFPARQNNVQFDPQGMGIPGAKTGLRSGFAGVGLRWGRASLGSGFAGVGLRWGRASLGSGFAGVGLRWGRASLGSGFSGVGRASLGSGFAGVGLRWGRAKLRSGLAEEWVYNNHQLCLDNLLGLDNSLSPAFPVRRNKRSSYPVQ
ncbi:PCBP3 [Branchiostoma lanceolatum]|uniref:PCBP3 protein n=1 Tax=Branchiostoma lanceolatum TaxID=7740 RepID=A0A8K0E9H0_BRALA|nr:PCBP3 [Branchiostoma lanceolatum]